MKRWSFSNLILVLGLLFIYLPMVILVIYSFNASRLVTVWGGWSLKWYTGLLDNSQLMGAVMRSLEVAAYTAVAAVALGTMAAFVLTRIPVFRGRTLFGGLVTAPLVMPGDHRSVPAAAVRGHGATGRLAGPARPGDHLDRPYHVLLGLRRGGGDGASA